MRKLTLLICLLVSACNEPKKEQTVDYCALPMPTECKLLYSQSRDKYIVVCEGKYGHKYYLGFGYSLYILWPIEDNADLFSDSCEAKGAINTYMKNNVSINNDFAPTNQSR